MITVHGFGPAMGLPEISPFVTKAHILLRLAGLTYETETNVGCEEHLYWLMIDVRWLDDANFRAGPSEIFRSFPAPLRPLIEFYARRTMRRTLHMQGLGRPLERPARRHFGATQPVVEVEAVLFLDMEADEGRVRHDGAVVADVGQLAFRRLEEAQPYA